MKKIAQRMRYMIKEALNFNTGRMMEAPYTKDPKTGKTVATEVFTTRGYIDLSVIQSAASSGHSIYITDKGWFTAGPSAGITQAYGVTSVIGKPIQPQAPAEPVGEEGDYGRTIP